MKETSAEGPKFFQIIVLTVSLCSAHGQGTFHFDFRRLSPGEIVAEQFSGQGVHFAPYVNAPPLQTASAPSYFDPAGATVGYSTVFLIKFDQPITRISFDMAQRDMGQWSHGAVWGLFAVDSIGRTLYDSEGQPLNLGMSGRFRAETRSMGAVTFPADAGVKFVLFRSVFDFAGEYFSEPVFIDNINVTTVPEPGSILLLAFGCSFIGLLSTRARHEDTGRE